MEGDEKWEFMSILCQSLVDLRDRKQQKIRRDHKFSRREEIRIRPLDF